MLTLHRAYESGGAAGAAGLVSVPTTPTRVAADAAALKRELGAFVPDVEKGRLARLRRSVGFAARAHAVSERGKRNDVPWMVTLTYAPGVEWEPTHLTRALDCLRLWCKRQGFHARYVWVAELQERGAVHYHVCVWLPRKIRKMPKWDLRLSTHRLARRWWPHGMTNRVVARNAVPYLMKYLSKGTAYASLPRGARSHGVGGLEHALRRARRWLGLPAMVQGNSSLWDRWERAVGGGWRTPGGDVLPSEWRRAWVGDGHALLRVCEHPRSIDASGPFSWLSDRAVALKAAH